MAGTTKTHPMALHVPSGRRGCRFPPVARRRGRRWPSRDGPAGRPPAASRESGGGHGRRGGGELAETGDGAESHIDRDEPGPELPDGRPAVDVSDGNPKTLGITYLQS